jgi:hypothetical protein
MKRHPPFWVEKSASLRIWPITPNPPPRKRGMNYYTIAVHYMKEARRNLSPCRYGFLLCFFKRLLRLAPWKKYGPSGPLILPDLLR